MLGRADALPGDDRRAEDVAGRGVAASGRTARRASTSVSGTFCLDAACSNSGTPAPGCGWSRPWRSRRAGDGRRRRAGDRRRRGVGRDASSPGRGASPRSARSRSCARRRPCPRSWSIVLPCRRRAVRSSVAPATVVVVAPAARRGGRARGSAWPQSAAPDLPGPAGSAARRSRRPGSRPSARSFTPGRFTTIVLPWRCTSGSAMPRPSTRLRMTSIAVLSALRSVPFTGNSTIEMPPWRSRPSTGRLSESSVATNVPTMTTTVDDQHDHVAPHGSAGLRGLAVRVECFVVRARSGPARSRPVRRGSPCRARSRARRRRRRARRPARRSRSS